MRAHHHPRVTVARSIVCILPAICAGANFDVEIRDRATARTEIDVTTKQYRTETIAICITGRNVIVPSTPDAARENFFITILVLLYFFIYELVLAN